jgi:hypothetical protein
MDFTTVIMEFRLALFDDLFGIQEKTDHKKRVPPAGGTLYM